MEKEQTQNKKIGIVFSVVIIFILVIITVIAENKKSPATVSDQSNSGSSTSIPSSTVPPATVPTTPKVSEVPPVDTTNTNTGTKTPVPVAAIYKDGTYSATGSYMSPGGEDQVAVTLTLANDIITSVTVTPQAGDRTSQRYQSRFVSGYKQYVVGKNIASVNLSKVSGSSLTPIGFNAALTQIKAQAKA